MKRLALAGFVAGLLLAQAGVGLGSSGHVKSTEWPNDATFKVDSARVAPLNTATAESEMESARNEYNTLGGSDFDFNLGANLAMATSLTVSNVPDNNVYMMDYSFGGSTLGDNLCRVGGFLFQDIKACLIRVDSSRSNWYISSTDPGLDQGQVDLRSLATHELGHALFFNDFSDSACSSWSSSYTTGTPTMCGTMLVSPFNNTYAIYRSLTDHEEDHVTGSY